VAFGPAALLALDQGARIGVAGDDRPLVAVQGLQRRLHAHVRQVEGEAERGHALQQFQAFAGEGAWLVGGAAVARPQPRRADQTQAGLPPLFQFGRLAHTVRAFHEHHQPHRVGDLGVARRFLFPGREHARQLGAVGHQLEHIRVFAAQPAVHIDLAHVQRVGLVCVVIHVLLVGRRGKAARGSEQGAEDDRHLAVLVVGPAEGGQALLRVVGVGFQRAGFGGGAAVVAPVRQHVISQIFVGIDHDGHGVFSKKSAPFSGAL